MAPLRFWGQFQKIHDDANILPEDKYEYLVQATVPGSRARLVVESFPQSRDNYFKAVESLKSRFGRDDLLVESYQRELLKLVVYNILHKGQVQLTSIYDQLETHIRSLESLGVTTDKSAGLLYPLVESCISDDILRVWQRTSEYRQESTMEGKLERLMIFLKNEVEGEEKIALAGSGLGLDEEIKHKKISSNRLDLPTAASLVTHGQKPGKDQEVSQVVCIFCEKSHTSEKCFSARKMSLQDRIDKVKQNRLCFGCLKNHRYKQCRVRTSCVVCNGHHIPLLCPQLDSMKNKQLTNSHSNSDQSSQNLLQHSLTTLESQPILLQTIVCYIRSNRGPERPVRILVDTGSQRSYILKSLVDELGLTSHGQEKLSHAVFGGSVSSEFVHGHYKIFLTDKTRTYSGNFTVLDHSVICGSIPSIIKGPWLQTLGKDGIKFTDFDGGPIEILIGADVAGKIFTGRIKKLDSGLVAIETLFGWTLMGRVPCQISESPTSHSMFVSSLPSISKLWELDVLGIENPINTLTREKEKETVHEHFLQTVCINTEGRYEINLPWLPNHPPLPSYFELAERRLTSTVNKLKADGHFEAYCQVFLEWLQEGIIEKVPTDEINIQGHYMPHRAVIRDSPTTPVRPVFDASARLKNHPSLNQCLSKGVNLLELIPLLLLRFRSNLIGVTSDVRKAFLQISIAQHDRNFVRFLWLDDHGNKIQYRHARVVFGVTSSPYLLGAVINLHLDRMDHTKAFPQWVIDSLKKSFYCDNCVTSVSSPEELDVFIKSSTDIFKEAKMDLRGWEHTEVTTTGTQNSTTTHLLGYIWDRACDVLKIDTTSLQNFDISVPITKRVILSVAHRIFDPIGFTSAVILIPKILLQMINTDWDELVEPTIAQKFLKWAKDLHKLNLLSVPRWFGSKNSKSESWTFHTFCDASCQAYACVIFLVIRSCNNTIIRLIQAKSRVAPSKQNLSIPRLELLAALIGVRLASSILSSFDKKDIRACYYTDSTCVLAWIKLEEEWATFVGNRIKEIREISSPNDWFHISGSVNPADLISRGCSVDYLLSSRWCDGPEWLAYPESQMPVNKFTEFDKQEVSSEKRKREIIGVSHSLNNNSTSKDPWYAHQFSKFDKTVRMIGWINRFITNCQKKQLSASSEQFLSACEFDNAEKTLIRLVQKDSFQSVFDRNLSFLSPFVDHEGIIRLKTKLINRTDSQEFRTPAVLPDNHPLTIQLLTQMHIRAHHVGAQGLLTLARERFWIIRGRRSVKSVIKNCIVCQKMKVKELKTPICPLPKQRVEDAAVFQNTGVDFTGPLYLEGGSKVWICIFTCALYRAVHLEVTESLSTSSFLMSLRRFINRRGRPSIIFSDNGTNFKGADNAFSQLDWTEITTQSAVQRIEWRFSPPTAAWWGGWWERLIRILKDLLRKSLGKTTLNHEELLTLVSDCESLMNGRPLTYVSEDPQDLIPLTPSMFLKDLPNDSTVDIDKIMNNQRLNHRIRYRQNLRKDLRNRFRSEYLGNLLRHSKDEHETRKLSVGDVVLIGDDDQRRLNWVLARIEELIPGNDGNCRLARLVTPRGKLLRPLRRIYPLEGINDENSRIQQDISRTETPVTKNQLATEKNRKTKSSQQITTRSGRTVKKPDRLGIIANNFVA